MMKKILCLLLVAVTAIGMLAGCNNTNTPGGKEPGTTDPVSTDDPDVNNEAELYRPVKEDLDNYTFRMVMDGGLDTQWYIYSSDNESSYTVLDTAFYKRNMFVEDYFNIGIGLRTLGADQFQMSTELAQCVYVGEDFADVIFAVAGHIMPSAMPNGYALNLNNIKGFNLDASYWDQRIRTGYSVNNMLFTLEGDYTTYDELCTEVVFFSEVAYNKFGYPEKYGSLYDLVRNKDWTIDKMLEMVKGASDLDKVDHDLTKNDNWGMISERWTPYHLYLGSGKSLIFQDPVTGALSSLFDNRSVYEETYNMLERLISEVGCNKEVMIIESALEREGILEGWGDVFQMFANNQALFYTPTLGTAGAFQGSMKDKFGILPIPMYYENQEEYYSVCGSQAHTPLMVPCTALEHAETTAKIMDAICYFSKYPFAERTQTVVDAEYEWLMINQICRSAEDREMLGIIFANKGYDLNNPIDELTGVGGVVYGHTYNRTMDGLTSDLKSLQGQAYGNLTRFMRLVSENVKN